MKREELLRSKGYWIAQLQIKLFETVKSYIKNNGLTQSEFADQIGVSKSYVSQVLNGDFDHKISKYVELLIACDKVPILNTMSLDEYINDDFCQFKHVLYASIDKDIYLNEKNNKTNKSRPDTVEISYSHPVKISSSKPVFY